MRLRLVHRWCAAPLIVILAFSAHLVYASERASIVDSLLELSDPLGSGWVLGDLDGDGETDIALSCEVEENDSGYLYRVELKLSRSVRSGSFTLANNDALGVIIVS